MTRRIAGLVVSILIFGSPTQASAQAVVGGPYFGPAWGSTWGPAIGPAYGWGYGWGNPWIVPFGFNNNFWFPGFFFSNAQAFPLGPNPGAFRASGGYGIGGGIYGPQRDLPVLIPKAPPRFATRDVKRHFQSIIENPQIAIDRQYRLFEYFDGRSTCVCAQSPLAAIDPQTIRVLVKAPLTSSIQIDGRPTTGTGTERYFVSPRLKPGQVYAVKITSKNGDGIQQTKWDNARPGELIHVNFLP